MRNRVPSEGEGSFPLGGSDSGGGWRPGLTARQRQELEADGGGERWR